MNNNPIRVLNIMPGIMDLAGAETMLMNYYRHFDREKVQMDFLCIGEQIGAYDHEIQRMGGRIYHIAPLHKNILKYMEAINYILKNNSYGIVHVHQDCLGFIPLLLARYNNIPCRVAHSHSTQHRGSNSFKNIMLNTFRKLIPMVATDYMACSMAAGKWMFGQRKFTVMYNAIDLETFSYNGQERNKVRSEYVVDEDALLIGQVGRFCKVKNQIFTLEILKTMLYQMPNVKLMLVGMGPEEENIRKYILENKLMDYVIVVPPHKDIFAFYSAFDVLLIPSLYEGLTLVAVEAQSCSLPCVISDTISSEVCVTDIVTTVSLDDEINHWIKAICKIVKTSRESKTLQVSKAGYSIANETIKLQNFYVEHSKEV
ncbi:MAG: glycosyltransferase family 1 protein [Oscillospiraceae bacterium]